MLLFLLFVILDFFGHAFVHASAVKLRNESKEKTYPLDFQRSLALFFSKYFHWHLEIQEQSPQNQMDFIFLAAQVEVSSRKDYSSFQTSWIILHSCYAHDDEDVNILQAPYSHRHPNGPPSNSWETFNYRKGIAVLYVRIFEGVCQVLRKSVGNRRNGKELSLWCFTLLSFSRLIEAFLGN